MMSRALRRPSEASRNSKGRRGSVSEGGIVGGLKKLLGIKSNAVGTEISGRLSETTMTSQTSKAMKSRLANNKVTPAPLPTTVEEGNNPTVPETAENNNNNHDNYPVAPASPPTASINQSAEETLQPGSGSRSGSARSAEFRPAVETTTEPNENGVTTTTTTTASRRQQRNNNQSIRRSFMASVSEKVKEFAHDMKLVPFMDEEERKEYENVVIAECQGELDSAALMESVKQSNIRSADQVCQDV
jgi:hypothetical protein